MWNSEEAVEKLIEEPDDLPSIIYARCSGVAGIRRVKSREAAIGASDETVVGAVLLGIEADDVTPFIDTRRQCVIGTRPIERNYGAIGISDKRMRAVLVI